MEANFEFFIYAFPAMNGCCGIRGKEIGGFLEMILRGEAPSESELDEMFPAAKMRRREKYGDDYWSFKNTKEYWWVEHNRIIDAEERGYEDASEEEKEHCKVGFWRVESVNKKGIVKLRNGRKTISAYNFRNLSLKNGGYVTTHKGHVIEDISFEDFKEYG